MSRPDDDGSITVLVIGYTAIAILLLVVGIAASKVFLARRSLAAAADQAALHAAEAVGTAQIYSGGLSCGEALPLNSDRAREAASDSLAESKPDLGHSFSKVGGPKVSVDAGVVTVQLTGTVGLPFRSYLGWLDPGHGQVTVTETSHAQSPVASC